MPQFFDEIDDNLDGFITLDEVNRALERRVDAAMEASNAARRYGSAHHSQEIVLGVALGHV